jgi:outer membrane lipoprotein SlyB
MEVEMSTKTLFRVQALIILGCVTLQTASLVARSRDNDDYYEDGEERRGTSSAAKGGLIGGTTGAVVGGIAGGPVGAVVGGTVVGGSGAIIGHERDKKRSRRSRRRAEREQDELERLREENAALKRGK